MLTNWLRKNGRNFKRISSDEVTIDCPKCGHSKFYFNVKKRIGFCHRASCHWKPNEKKLAEFWGSEPEDTGWFPSHPVYEKKLIGEIHLPRHAVPVITRFRDSYITQYPEPYEWLKKRNLTPEQIYRWGIHATSDRIYVPVYYKGKLEQYVGRYYGKSSSAIKYTYAVGARITDFLFGWDDQDWNWMTLVENTFVSIWLRNYINCTTNFGSFLSTNQAELIYRSKIKEVILLWDEDAFPKALETRAFLHRLGVTSKAICIVGQPDDYPLEFIKEIIDIVRSSTETKHDFSGVCQEIKGIQNPA